ncbi:class I SAM-dependent methyltransferase [Actinokineospora bangkokensis]|uniref:Methyltransferase type 11 domain-containing protein n=1 Tax=Actinokineospora bangkokensis TaxID=1193682 RepID=A0A1Q9LTK9_9PSEU|nr:methyltransferase domain-containing protein [Actinokineospora bangkokensis]OLR95368.1 hypothetical protein BJP25_06320 [Actinokineospora bangkokensis]
MFPDFSRAPNIAGDPDLYERENAAIDPSGALWRALRAEADWAGRVLLDLGCGTGSWLPRYADAAQVIGVEPDPDLLVRAARRGDARAGSAEHIPLPDASVDVVHARFAYFFPPGCDAGLAEVLRVLRPGGTLVVIDNDWHRGEFADLLRVSAWAAPQGSGATTDAWWAERGARRTAVLSAWRCADPAELAAVLRLEFPGELVDAWVAGHPGRAEISCGYALFAVQRQP